MHVQLAATTEQGALDTARPVVEPGRRCHARPGAVSVVDESQRCGSGAALDRGRGVQTQRAEARPRECRQTPAAFWKCRWPKPHENNEQPTGRTTWRASRFVTKVPGSFANVAAGVMKTRQRTTSVLDGASNALRPADRRIDIRASTGGLRWFSPQRSCSGTVVMRWWSGQADESTS